MARGWQANVTSQWLFGEKRSLSHTFLAMPCVGLVAGESRRILVLPALRGCSHVSLSGSIFSTGLNIRSACQLAEISSLRSPALLGFARRILLGLPTLNLTSLHPSPSSGANIAFLQMHAHFRSKTSISWTDRSLAQVVLNSGGCVFPCRV